MPTAKAASSRRREGDSSTATHYKPLEGVTTVDEFLNRVYSTPLQIQAGMSEEQKARVLERRVACYERMEAAARNKKTGERNCEGMAPFAKTWTGLMCVGKKASIPSELPYARIAVELRGEIAKRSQRRGTGSEFSARRLKPIERLLKPKPTENSMSASNRR